MLQFMIALDLSEFIKYIIGAWKAELKVILLLIKAIKALLVMYATPPTMAKLLLIELFVTISEASFSKLKQPPM